jgi:catechol 2,3-dioxygenase-like lactoylglutathione lyase family enzyme
LYDPGVGEPEPAIGVGHISLRVTDVARSVDFYLSLGMREAHPPMRNMAILGLRGGTHLLLFRARRKPKASKLPFDLIVPDVDALQRSLRERGHVVGPMLTDRFSPHRYFSCEDPDGHVLTLTSDHTDDEAPGEDTPERP